MSEEALKPNPEETESGPDVATLLDEAAELAKLRAERDELNDRYLRRTAEFENYRRRVEREQIERLESAAARTVEPLLPILDDFERALKIETADANYAKGVELIYGRLFDALKKLGVEPIATEGQTFDPNIHQAIEMAETEDAPDQAILAEYARGYNFKGKLLRPSMVKVAVRK